MIKAVGILSLVGLLAVPAFAADCMSSQNKRCWTKSEVGGLSVYMEGGDPCFLYNNKRWCFVGMGPMEPCTCKPECGCGGPVAPPPTCDNSVVPKNVDCSAAKNVYCKIGGDNTMCTKCGVDLERCKNVCARGLTADEKKAIVDKHNELRRKVAKGLETRGGQPSATNMFELQWDEELATMAQTWADQCPDGHDTNRNTPTFAYVGQNIAQSWATQSVSDKGLTTKVEAWYNEVKDFPAANVASFSNNGATGTIGHYTQLIWGETTKVGCGFMQYQNEANRLPYEQLLICNYGPGGNMLSAPVYKAGKTASACTKGANDGLCIQ